MGTLPGLAGVRIGHAQHPAAPTGCTVILCERGATAGVDVRGAAPATRELDLLRPGNLVQQAHAVLLTGGSAFGLAAADGVMRWLLERGVGFPTPAAPVPIVPTLALYDLTPDPLVWPDADLGAQACAHALAADELRWGAVGAGTGATVGKLWGRQHASRGGVGLGRVDLADGLVVTAIVAVNAWGHVVDPATGQIVAGPRRPDGSFGDTVAELLAGRGTAGFATAAGQNTTIGCVITSAPLDRSGCTRVAAMAHDGLARVIRPAHTQYDGDALIVMSTNTSTPPLPDPTRVGVAAAEAVALAVGEAVIEQGT